MSKTQSLNSLASTPPSGEFPWLATRRSNFLAAFENFWSDRVFWLLLGLDAYKHSGKLMDASRIPPPENLTQPEKSAKFA